MRAVTAQIRRAGSRLYGGHGCLPPRSRQGDTFLNHCRHVTCYFQPLMDIQTTRGTVSAFGSLKGKLQCRFLGRAVFIALLACVVPSAIAQTDFTGGTGGAIPDATSPGENAGNPNAGVFTSDITLSDPGTIASFNSITLDNFQHTAIDDLVFELTHVGWGTTVVFLDRVGKTSATTGFGYPADMNGNYTFETDLSSTLTSADSIWDAAAIYQNSGTIPGGIYAATANAFTGSYSSSYQPTDLNIFTNEPIDGTWELTVRDEAQNDVGTFSSWQFNATITAIPEPVSFALIVLGGLISLVLVTSRRRSI